MNFFEKLEKLNNRYIAMYRYAPYHEAVNIILDIETGGNKIYCEENYSVFSIGMSVFCPDKNNILKLNEKFKFNEVIDREDSKRLGFIEDPNVMEWWENKTSKEAKETTLFGGNKVKIVLERFIDFILEIMETFPKKTIYVWGKAPEFDVSYVYKYFQVVYGLGYLFPFWSTRDIRTIENGSLLEKDTLFKFYEESNVMAHNAYNDTLTEGKILSEVVMNSLSGRYLLQNYEKKQYMLEKEIDLQIVTMELCSHCSELKTEIDQIKKELKKTYNIKLNNVEFLDSSEEPIYKWAKDNDLSRMPTTLIILNGNIERVIKGFISKELFINSIINFFLNQDSNKVTIKKYKKE